MIKLDFTMKNMILIFSMLITLSSCSDDSTDCVSMDCLNIDYGNINYDSTDCNDADAFFDDANTNNQDIPLIGSWELIRVEYINETFGLRVFDHCDDNITYTFESNGVLTVASNPNLVRFAGTYKYEFGEFTNFHAIKELLVIIDGQEWLYFLNNGIMVLDQSDVDGPILYFKRESKH